MMDRNSENANGCWEKWMLNRKATFFFLFPARLRTHVSRWVYWSAGCPSPAALVARTPSSSWWGTVYRIQGVEGGGGGGEGRGKGASAPGYPALLAHHTSDTFILSVRNWPICACRRHADKAPPGQTDRQAKLHRDRQTGKHTTDEQPDEEVQQNPDS